MPVTWHVSTTVTVLPAEKVGSTWPAGLRSVLGVIAPQLAPAPGVQVRLTQDSPVEGVSLTKAPSAGDGPALAKVRV